MNQLAAPHRQQQADHPDDRGFPHLAHPPEAQVAAHEHRNGDRRADREQAPRAFGQRLHHHQRQHRQQNDDDRQDGEQRDVARRGVQLLLHHLAERLAVAPQRRKQHHEVLHRPAQRHADQYPERPRQVAELRRQHRPHQRSRAGDRREVLAEDDPLVRLDEVLAVVMHLARRGPPVIERQHPRRQPLRIKPVADGVTAQRGDEDISRVEPLAAMERERRISPRPRNRDQQPQQVGQDSLHFAPSK